LDALGRHLGLPKKPVDRLLPLLDLPGLRLFFRLSPSDEITGRLHRDTRPAAPAETQIPTQSDFPRSFLTFRQLALSQYLGPFHKSYFLHIPIAFQLDLPRDGLSFYAVFRFRPPNKRGIKRKSFRFIRKPIHHHYGGQFRLDGCIADPYGLGKSGKRIY